MNAQQIVFLFLVASFFIYFGTAITLFILHGIYSPSFIMQNLSLSLTFDSIASPLFLKALIITTAVVLFLMAVFPHLVKEKVSLHGTARFANANEILKIHKLFEEDGLIVGKFKNRYLRFNSQEFVSVGAPTRSGKGVSIVIPNLLDYKESAVVLDIKQECFDITSKYRKEKLEQEIYLFNPFDFRTHRYNPLTYINMSDPRTRDNDLLDFVSLLYPLHGDEATKFFNSLAQNLFIGICYLFNDLTTNKNGQELIEKYSLKVEFTMYGILRLSQGFRIAGEELGQEEGISGFDTTIEYLEYEEIISEKTREKLDSYLSIESQNTKAGVLSSFNCPLLIFSNEPIKTATSTSDFDLRELRKKKMTIYIGVLPDKIAIAKPILNIFFSQLFSLNTKQLPSQNPELKHSVLLLMDEFTSIGNMPILLKGVAYIAGYNLRLLTIFQSDSQLENAPPEGYGKEGSKTLLKNHSIKVFFAPDDVEDAEKLSRRLGYMTHKSESKSRPNGFTSSGGSTSESDQKRALMLPQELMELGFENQLITKANAKPILAKKVLYYQDRYFVDKLKSVSTYLNTKKLPTQKDYEKAVIQGDLKVQIPIQGVKK